MRRLTTIAVTAALVAFAAPAAADTLPPLNPAALEAAIAGLPNDEASGALLQVRGRAGPGRAPPASRTSTPDRKSPSTAASASAA